MMTGMTLIAGKIVSARAPQWPNRSKADKIPRKGKGRLSGTWLAIGAILAQRGTFHRVPKRQTGNPYDAKGGPCSGPWRGEQAKGHRQLNNREVQDVDPVRDIAVLSDVG